MSAREHITFSYDDPQESDSITYTGSRGHYHAKHLPLCAHRWVLYRDGRFICRVKGFELLSRAALRHEAQAVESWT